VVFPWAVVFCIYGGPFSQGGSSPHDGSPRRDPAAGPAPGRSARFIRYHDRRVREDGRPSPLPRSPPPPAARPAICPSTDGPQASACPTRRARRSTSPSLLTRMHHEGCDGRPGRQGGTTDRHRRRLQPAGAAHRAARQRLSSLGGDKQPIGVRSVLGSRGEAGTPRPGTGWRGADKGRLSLTPPPGRSRAHARSCGLDTCRLTPSGPQRLIVPAAPAAPRSPGWHRCGRAIPPLGSQ
jgi:hypothetical protein